jgi:hypothetical protein
MNLDQKMSVLHETSRVYYAKVKQAVNVFLSSDIEIHHRVTKSRALLFSMREVLDSDLGFETGYRDCKFSWLPSVLPDKRRDRILK